MLRTLDAVGAALLDRFYPRILRLLGLSQLPVGYRPSLAENHGSRLCVRCSASDGLRKHFDGLDDGASGLLNSCSFADGAETDVGLGIGCGLGLSRSNP